jgi:serine/threonine protein kinase
MILEPNNLVPQGLLALREKIPQVGAFKVGGSSVVIDVLVMPVYVMTLEQLPVPIADEVACKVALQITKALNYLHNQGFAHCDVKPSNIFLDAVGFFLVSAFCPYLHRLQAGDFFLGDYGGLCTLGSTMMEVTDAFMPTDCIASAANLDFLLLASSIAIKVGFSVVIAACLVASHRTNSADAALSCSVEHQHGIHRCWPDGSAIQQDRGPAVLRPDETFDWSHLLPPNSSLLLTLFLDGSCCQRSHRCCWSA